LGYWCNWANRYCFLKWTDEDVVFILDLQSYNYSWPRYWNIVFPYYLVHLTPGKLLSWYWVSIPHH